MLVIPKEMPQKQEDGPLPHFPNAAFDVVALASSLGGLKALSQILSTLPLNFPAAIVVVQHLQPHHCSLMAEILNSRTGLTVKQAEQGDQLLAGNVYIAPPNQHLLIGSDRMLCLSSSAPEHFSRPAANPLFESLAISLKERAIAVVLTGRDSDGATGIMAIKKMGGLVIVQDEATSESFSMPSAAIATGSVDLILPLNQISPMLVSLVMTAKTC